MQLRVSSKFLGEETPELEVDAPQAAERRRREDKKMQWGEGVTDRRSREGEGGSGWPPPAEFIPGPRRKNKQLLSVNICFTLFIPSPHVKELHGFFVLTGSVVEICELEQRRLFHQRSVFSRN